MADEVKAPADLINDIFSLAYWMTGSMKASNDLVYKTFQVIESDSEEIDVYRKFRDCYYEKMNLDHSAGKSHGHFNPLEKVRVVLSQQETDRKLSVLLSEICRLPHKAIAKVIGKPLDTVRMWLSSGRKMLRDGLLIFLVFSKLAIA